MNTGQTVLLVAVVAAVAFGAWRAVTDGRFRGTHRIRRAGSAVAAEPSTWEALAGSTPEAPGDRSTLVQFSSAFCAPCRATRRVLMEVADLVPGVKHIEIDAEHHLDVVRRLGILRTPTTLVLGPDGHEVLRAQGQPTKQQVLAALAPFA
jgi:thiol-disulfide isomerase/thioredoxin